MIQVGYGNTVEGEVIKGLESGIHLNWRQWLEEA